MTEGYEVQKLIRVATAVVRDTGLVYGGVRSDGRNIGFIIENSDPEAPANPRENSTVSFNLDLNRLLVDDMALTMTQYRSLLGIAAFYDIDFVSLEDLED